MTENKVDVVIIGAGQAGLAVAYFLKRANINFVLLDQQENAGGAWQHTWDSLNLFSPATYSSLPGWVFPKTTGPYPTKSEVVNYLRAYEQRYEFPVQRPVKVERVEQTTSGLRVISDTALWEAKTVVSCTGSWSTPYIPNYQGLLEYTGRQVHSAHYSNPEEFIDKKVLIVGGGNSGAQILAEVSKVATTTWVTQREPTFLSDDVDGRILFDIATQKYQAKQEGRVLDAPPSLGDIVMIDTVKEARSRNVLKSRRPFIKFDKSGVFWNAEDYESFDAVIWCTGFRPTLDHLQSLNIIEENGTIQVNETRSVLEPRLWLVGYGEWTGFGSATLIGVQRYARSTANEISQALNT